jgi:hypothetical protein
MNTLPLFIFPFSCAYIPVRCTGSILILHVSIKSAVRCTAILIRLRKLVQRTIIFIERNKIKKYKVQRTVI